MRIDSSGNVLVGKTDTTRATAGAEVRANGFIRGTRDQGHAFDAVRTGNDGPSIKVYRDNSDAGSIGNFGTTNMVMGSGICGIRYNGSNLTPFHITNYANTDDTLSLGHPSIRWDNVYATNGTIQTSDQNEKQSIQSLTTAEMNVAKRLSPLIKTFKWNSAVEEKGDNARTHIGIIAQNVQQSFTDEGLDANNYALFCSDTWWEKEIFVEATEEQDAHTYIDYKEEATDGYTERTRLGVRYPQLLSFIQAYNDQRFNELEARITTLENA
jgi:hypothetical protein